jgi:hypothetical protein
MHAQKCEMEKKSVPLAKYLFGTVTGNAGQIARNHNFCMEERHLCNREQTIKSMLLRKKKNNKNRQ